MTATESGVVQPSEPGFRRVRFLKHSAIYGSSQILVRGISVVLLPFYTRLLSPLDYGVMETIGIAVALLTTALPLEISQAVGRFYTDSRDDVERRAIASTGLWFTLAVFGVFALGPLISAPEVSRWMLASEDRVSIVQVAAVGLVLQGLFYISLEQLRWQIKPGLHAVTGLVSTLVLIGVTAVLILGFHTGVIGVFYGQLIGNSVGFGMALWFARSSYAFTFDAGRLRQMLAYAAPLVPSTAAVVVASMVDRVAIRSFMSLTALGIYGIANRFAIVIILVTIGVNGAFMPLVLRHHHDRATPAAIADVLRYFVYLGTVIFLGMSLFSGWILQLIATPPFYGANSIVPVVILVGGFSSMWVFTPGLVLAKRTKLIAGINIAAAVVNTVLVIWLVPLFGLLGAAMGTAISFFGAFVALMAMSQREYPAPHQWLRLGIAFSIAAAAVIVQRAAFPTNPAAENAYTFLIECGLFVSVSALVSLLLLDRREITELLRRSKFIRGPTSLDAGH